MSSYLFQQVFSSLFSSFHVFWFLVPTIFFNDFLMIEFSGFISFQVEFAKLSLPFGYSLGRSKFFSTRSS